MNATNEKQRKNHYNLMSSFQDFPEEFSKIGTVNATSYNTNVYIFGL